jgi:hypothetical protein
MQNETQNKKPPLQALFITKNGTLIARALLHAPRSVTLPVNLAGDSRLFLKNGEIVHPFVEITFRHVRNVPLAIHTLAIYEETGQSEFDVTELVPAPIFDLEAEFRKLNPELAA